MSILYLLTAPPPPMHGTDAVFNEVSALTAAIGGDALNLYPLATPLIRVPRQLYGMHAVPSLKRAEKLHAINHVYFPVLHWFPVLGFLRNPIVYTVTATLDRSRPPGKLSRLRSLARIVVSNQRDADTLDAWGLKDIDRIPPAAPTAGIERRPPLPLTSELTLLMASAPWHPSHFDTKGVDVLLETVAAMPDLRLILVWRGLLLDELRARVARLGIGDRVDIHNEKVDISEHLARAHAAVLLAKHGYVIKAYPHSLVEAVAAGKPVLISDKIPMADFIRERGCGLVVGTTTAALTHALIRLRGEYEQLTSATHAVPQETFSPESHIHRHRRMYASILADQNV